MITLPGCPVCDGTSSRPRYFKFGLPLVECGGCGLVYANPRLTPEEIWKRYSPDYFWNEYLPAQGVKDGHVDLEYFDGRNACMLQLIARRRPNRGRLVEVGAGGGFFLKAAERSGWDVAGIEITIFDPDLDPDGSIARGFVDGLVDLFASARVHV